MTESESCLKVLWGLAPFCVHPLDESTRFLFKKKVKKVKKNEKPNKIRHLRRSVYDVGPDASLPNVLTGSHGLVTVPTLGGVITEHFNTV
jgi:hypothetical protein